MTGDQKITLITAVAGPVLAALVTGAALLFQSALNNRLQRDRQRAELAEGRRREEAQARAEWAAAFQNAISAERGLLRDWETISEVGDALKDRAIANAESRNVALARCSIATARLQVADRDMVVRAQAQAMNQSITCMLPGRATPEQRKEVVRSQIERLDRLSIAFFVLMDELAGLGGDQNRQEGLRQIVQGSTLPAAVKAKVLAAMTGRTPSD